MHMLKIMHPQYNQRICLCAGSSTLKYISILKTYQYLELTYFLLHSTLLRFDKIINKEIPSTVVYEDDKVLPDVLCSPHFICSFIPFFFHFFMGARIQCACTSGIYIIEPCLKYRT